ncbi:MAG: FkbM family methyltransferase [Acidobacteriota bacterium]|nr:FkbM family methyltransferase [Acidobacteriota bacterium]
MTETGLGIKERIKIVRASRSLNNLATTTLRGLFAITGRQPEFLIKHLPRTGLTAVKLPNGRLLKIEASGEEWIPTQLFWRGWQGYEPEMTGLFYNLAESATTVLDVGAHTGFYSLLASLANPQAKVFAFEPMPRVFASLERNINLNDLKNVKCFRAAVGAASGVQHFYFPDQEQPISSSLRSDMLVATFPADSIKHVPVSVVTLDEFVVEHGIAHVDLIKLDTERTEHDVLAGALELLRRDRPDIICEVWPDAGNQNQLEDVLRPLGYHFFHLLPDKRTERTEIVGSEQFLNYFFTVRPDAQGTT